jgi:hypothetical protein
MREWGRELLLDWGWGLDRLGGWSRRCGGLSGRCAGFGGRRQDETFADEGEALLGEFGLEELVVRAGEDVCGGTGEGGFEVVDGDGLGVERPILVS